MKQVLFLSGHLFESKRHANFHHIAKACAENENSVTFCTVPNSINTLLTQKHNIKNRIFSYWYALFPKKLNRLTVTSYISFAYPLNSTPKLNKLLLWFFNHGYSKVLKNNYDVVIIENGIPLLLFEKLKKLNPVAKFTYRVSDPIKIGEGWSGFLKYEKSVIEEFDLVSTPATLITKRLQTQYPRVNLKTHYHGIDKTLFSQKYVHPFISYVENNKHFVFVGASKLDTEFIKIASTISDDYIFHIIGPFEDQVARENVKYYGEMKFEATIAYIQQADVCLQTLVRFPYCEVYERTLKFTQYSFFKKPILAPYYMELKDANVFSYTLDNISIKDAINKALNYDSRDLDTSWIKTWGEIAEELYE